MSENFYLHACVESPLYTKFSYGEHFAQDGADTTIDLVDALLDSRLQFDCFCIYCSQEATFARTLTGGKTLSYQSTFLLKPFTSFYIRMHCTRRSHSYIFLFRKEGGVENGGFVQKIGMYPSMEDIASSNLKKYRGLITKEDFSELHRAGGLASYGVGIGSFVYLRRIFEKQINAHYERRCKDKGEVNGFATMRMAEKIIAIAEYLPSALVEHREVYSILSKGLHELDENTCLAFFPALKQAIVMILEQDYQIREKQKAADDLKKSLEDIMRKIPN